MNDNTTQQIEYVSRRLDESFNLFGREVEGRVWLWILIPLLIIGAVYVVWMYVRDGRSVGWLWAGFLGLLRLTVYAILAAVFLLPAIQTWEESKTQSKVVLATDTSLSMTQTRDDIPSEAVPYEKMKTRQDKVLDLLTDPNVAFFKRLMERNPVTVYRWGLGVDEEFLVLKDGRKWTRKEWEQLTRGTGDEPRPEGVEMTREDWTAWLKPTFDQAPPDSLKDDEKKTFTERQERMKRLFAGTNVGESALGVVTREINNMVQGVVVFTDGRSTQGAPQAFKDLRERAQRAKVPIFVVAVGEDRLPVRIDIADARGPDAARPEDPFPISVDVTGEGLPNREVTVYLDVYKPGQKPGKDQPFKTLEKRVTFQPATPPLAKAEFPIAPEEYGEVPTEKPDEPDGDKPATKPGDKPAPRSNKPELAEGEWSFVPRVPKDKSEIFAGKEHTREPVVVKVIKRPMRVLLFTSVASREYQFVNSLMIRESDKKRVELSIYLQGIPGQSRRTGIVQGVPPERMLTRFPDRLDTKDNEDRVYNLANYDVIVAFDPDWTELSKEQASLVEQWVSQQGGGLIIVAAPIHTLELARPGAGGGPRSADTAKLKPILDVYPVVLKDARLEKERNSADPVQLKFPGADPDMEFLKLDDEDPKKNPLDAWKEFFFGPKGDGNRVLRGMHGFYPVARAKDGCVTVATFSDPLVQDAAGKEAPYLVLQPRYGRGRVVWLGSGEMWRLRQYREVWHERFWTKLTRYASAGSVGQGTRRIIPNVGRTFPAGRHVEVQAQMFGRDLKPLSMNAKPKMALKLPTGVSDKEIPLEYEMAPKASPGEWEGWFTGRFLVRSPGEYTLEMRLPDSNEVATSKFTVIEVNPELENTRPDLNALYELASEADDVLARLDDAGRANLMRALSRFKPVTTTPGEKAAGGDKDKLRLVFDLKTAELIPDCMQSRQNIVRNRGAVQDLWDEGLPLWQTLFGAAALFGLVAGVLLVVALIMLAMGQPVQGLLIGMGMTLLLAVASVAGAFYTRGNPGLTMSIVLVAIVALLSVEWLTRKLLRLA